MGTRYVNGPLNRNGKTTSVVGGFPKPGGGGGGVNRCPGEEFPGKSFPGRIYRGSVRRLARGKVSRGRLEVMF